MNHDGDSSRAQGDAGGESESEHNNAAQRAATATDHPTRAETILADAHSRDDEADSRDSVADERDRAASLQSFLHDEDYDAGNRARRAAAMDRSDSKADRASAAADRNELAEDHHPPDAGRT